jgi:hypothetical protein
LEIGGLRLEFLKLSFLVFELLSVALGEGAFFGAAFQGLQVFADACWSSKIFSFVVVAAKASAFLGCTALQGAIRTPINN